jgi:hypothetical protein
MFCMGLDLNHAFDFFGRFALAALGFAAFLCWGGLFATTPAARSKRSHASGCNSIFPLSRSPPMKTSPSSQEARSIILQSDPAYWQALGQFIEAFAVVEASIFTTLAYYAKVTPSVARALFSGTRVDASISYIRRIWEVRPLKAPGRRADLDAIFQQLKAMTDMRNRILHYGTIVTSDRGRITSTHHRALVPDKIEERRASVQDLMDMTHDTALIANALLWDLHPETRAKRGTRGYTQPILGSAWRYKPELPTAQQKAVQGKKWDRRRE